ncbi:hypothetical protein QCA50_012385 [Cerrena zonata]|uniref:Uncharacterized protein n=1 Tax=Cerrena zonata TaxID=2478898 RepID=A0AAW0G3C9_9APHY
MARIKQLKKRQRILNRIIVKKEASEPPKPPKVPKPSPKPPSHRMTTRAGAKRKAAPEPAVHVTKKRKAPAVKTRKVEKSSSTPPTPDPRKRQLIEFSNAELQMAKYINELAVSRNPFLCIWLPDSRDSYVLVVRRSDGNGNLPVFRYLPRPRAFPTCYRCSPLRQPTPAWGHPSCQIPRWYSPITQQGDTRASASCQRKGYSYQEISFVPSAR